MLPISIGWNVPFNEAIQATVARKVVLPDLYYGSLQGLHRQLAFSIANVTSVDQLQAVLDSLTHSLKTGETFAQWQKNIAVKDLGLPKYRLDNIFRTNIQSAYNRGHWEQQLANKSTRPYLMYDAINDSRTRPSHKAMDGIIRSIDDPFWSTHYPPNGYRCRCRCISLNERQAIERSNPDNNGNPQGIYKGINPETMKPDTGWDYNVGEDLMTGIDRAIAERMTAGKVNAPLVEHFKEQQAKQPTPIIDKQAFSSWVDTVSQPDYKARHEFMRVGILPDSVMADSEVFALNPINNEINISDYQFKHSQRAKKESPLPIEILKQLPEKLTLAKWFFDSEHQNLMAVFDIGMIKNSGKAVVTINFKRGNRKLNSIITSGMIDQDNTGMDIYRGIP